MHVASAADVPGCGRARCSQNILLTDGPMTTVLKIPVLLFAAALASQSALAQQTPSESKRILDPPAPAIDPSPNTSPSDKRPRVGERFTEPPPTPPVPESLVDPVYSAENQPLTLPDLESIACAQN